MATDRPYFRPCRTRFASMLALLLAAIVACLVPVTALAAEGDVEMHRLYNPFTGEHFYTASVSERDGLQDAGWRYEGVGWVAPASGDPVYRLYNPYVPGGDHHYTLSEQERDSLVAVGWRYEGVGWRSYATNGVPLYRKYNPYAQTGTHNSRRASRRTTASSRRGGVRKGWLGTVRPRRLPSASTAGASSR